MKVSFRNRFARDLKKIKEQDLRDRIRQAIEEVEKAEALDKISGLKKLSGAENCYRIQIGDYRLGVVFAAETVEFVRCLHRKEVYRYFP